MSKIPEDIDIQILTLGRWRTSQGRTITSLLQDETDNWKYLSFQNYHFIDITKVQLKENIFSDVFVTLQNIKKDAIKNIEKVYIQIGRAHV